MPHSKYSNSCGVSIFSNKLQFFQARSHESGDTSCMNDVSSSGSSSSSSLSSVAPRSHRGGRIQSGITQTLEQELGKSCGSIVQKLRRHGETNRRFLSLSENWMGLKWAKSHPSLPCDASARIAKLRPAKAFCHANKKKTVMAWLPTA